MKSMGAAKAAIASGRPPRRGTWIEIFFPKTVDRLRLVVPRVGGRGLNIKKWKLQVVPRVGGRGLKWAIKQAAKDATKSSPA